MRFPFICDHCCVVIHLEFKPFPQSQTSQSTFLWTVPHHRNLQVVICIQDRTQRGHSTVTSPQLPEYQFLCVCAFGKRRQSFKDPGQRGPKRFALFMPSMPVQGKMESFFEVGL
ncbi:hypothetical protein TNCT_674561 [Trichonephila clavata]|uniref:Uncharacterized protein n=1 Tax=Trichonephila clavata TaxID=2740835 RepID=A0A8X6FBH3_TRICU|nr:hypothetical protein TNCT_674561 [Trichonephila clavata]